MSIIGKIGLGVALCTLGSAAALLPDHKQPGTKAADVKAAEVKSPKVQQPSCKTQWKLCTDNGDMANNYENWSWVKGRCGEAADKTAKYDDPKWSWKTFSYIIRGDDYPKTGIVTLVDQDVKFQNKFGTYVKSKVTCEYDLNKGDKGEVLNVQAMELD